MAAHRIPRAAARPLGRSLGAFSNPCPAGRQRFTTTTSVRRAAAGKGQGPRTASSWPLPGVFAIAAGAGLLGWGISEVRHRGLPGTVLLDSMFPGSRYASMREMEEVCWQVKGALNKQ
jgi:D-lactate dehydrogenase (cytochrome)